MTFHLCTKQNANIYYSHLRETLENRKVRKAVKSSICFKEDRILPWDDSSCNNRRKIEED